MFFVLEHLAQDVRVELKDNLMKGKQGGRYPLELKVMKILKKYNCFVMFKNNDLFLFNPYSLANGIIENTCSNKSDYSIYKLIEKNRELLENANIIMDKKLAVSISKYYSDKSKYSNTIMISDAMTFKCNMNCIYCFESSLKEKNILSMDDRAKYISDFLKMFSDDFESVDYVFFGGEPLIFLKYIEKMCKVLNKNFNNKSLHFSITTNGTLINNHVIKLLNQYNFEELRITVDGPKSIHDNRRILKSGESSFELIINNIKKICENTDSKVIINTVLDENNINYYINMYNQIKESLEQYIINENPRIIFNVGLLCNPMIDTNYTKNLKNINISIEYYYLASKLIDLGATITNPFYFPHCLNSSEKSFTIDPSGNIYKCVSGIGQKNFLLSSYNEFIENPLIMLKNNILQIEKSHEKRCIGCEFLSMCNGGCKFNSLKNSIKSCRKTIISEEIEYLMELLYKGEFDENGFFRKKLYKN